MGIVCVWIFPSRSEHTHQHLGSTWGDLINRYEQGDQHLVTVGVVVMVVVGIAVVDSAAVGMVEAVMATGDPDLDLDRDLLTTEIDIEEWGISNKRDYCDFVNIELMLWIMELHACPVLID